MNNLDFTFQSVHLHLFLLFADFDIILEFKHGSAADLEILSFERDAIDLLLVGFIFVLEFLDFFILFDDFEFEYFDDIFVVLDGFGFVLKVHFNWFR